MSMRLGSTAMPGGRRSALRRLAAFGSLAAIRPVAGVAQSAAGSSEVGGSGPAADLRADTSADTSADTGLRPPIADAHSHFALRPYGGPRESLKAAMQEGGVTLLAWAIPADRRWLRNGPHGVEPVGTPSAGPLAAGFFADLEGMKRYLAQEGLPAALTPADVDSAASGAAHVVMAAEGADFLEGRPDGLPRAYESGLRHLQLVHYIASPVGDRQTDAPTQGGLSAFGVQVVQACNRLGVLVDLAHSTSDSIARALEVSSVPVIWSHSQLTTTPYSWHQAPNLSRRLPVEDARLIARRGGAIGLWASSRVGWGTGGYASELIAMINVLGPDHVMFGTDTGGVGANALIERPSDLRRVVDDLLARGVPPSTVRAVCFDNYARCLKAAMAARSA